MDPLQSEPKRIRKNQDRYPFSQCEYFATTTSYLKKHFENKHKGVRYPCSQCEYFATTTSNLKRHVEIKHEGVRYPCLQCEYAAITASVLVRHVEIKHKRVPSMWVYGNYSKSPEESCCKYT